MRKRLSDVVQKFFSYVLKLFDNWKMTFMCLFTHINYNSYCSILFGNIVVPIYQNIFFPI